MKKRVVTDSMIGLEMPDIDQWSDTVTVVLGQNPGMFSGPGTNTYLVGPCRVQRDQQYVVALRRAGRLVDRDPGVTRRARAESHDQHENREHPLHATRLTRVPLAFLPRPTVERAP